VAVKSDRQAGGWWAGLLERQPGLFAHWRVVRTYYG